MTSQPRKIPHQLRSQSTVNALLEATAHILVHQGYVGVTTNRVAEKAGVSIGSLYQYFPNKQALLVALRRRHAETMQTTLLAMAPRSNNLRIQIDELVAAIMKAHEEDSALHQALENEVPEHILVEDDHANKTVQTLLISLLEPHRKVLLPSDIALACRILLPTVDTLIHQALRLSLTERYVMQQEISHLVKRYLLADT